MVLLIDPVGGEAESLALFPIASPYPAPVGDPNIINQVFVTDSEPTVEA